ncbi:tail-specific protease [Tamlana haliotis]|uniref:Tail-specific protease n=1 Tax=Pseudotamlana haliotis TaxID=2614804 RepID=A0A6N6MEK7_9FLAO|nr:carboxy terminal-processing peptidase [Tamlana haliotis]KAB1069192.1 tail-specific protease [Tamlana haliotis]
MKRNYKVFSLLFLLAFASCSFTTKKFSNPDKDKLLIQIITFVLEQGHVDPIKIDDQFSEKLFNHYIQTVDPVKRYFYASDIEYFEKYKYLLDEQIQNKEITFFNVVHERLLERIGEGEAMYKDILSKPFDYRIDETYETDYEKTDFVRYKKQMRERWRQLLKFSTISNYDDLIKQEEMAKEKDPSYVMKSKEELEKEARESTLKSIDIHYHDNIDDLSREDYFAVYVNSIVEEYDPHTYYLAPKSKEDFDQRMSGKLEGIGARLQKRMDYIKIVELISGGPAWRSKKLEVEDVILKARQEHEDHPVSLVGMRIGDAIKYIKGPKGSKVTLTIKKVDGTIKDVTIVRDVVELVETYAKSSVVEKDGHKFGIINLPAFYVDFKDYKNVNAAKDVKEELERLKADGMEGLVLDLRNNGGGSLPTVVEMAGLFIKDGPIVQVRSSGENKEVLKDKDKSVTWDGPMVILVNEISASASEIMSAAMQDYKRAIIIGGKQTYGKGTVQNVINLNNMLRNNTSGDLGALAVTTQKYYRITGGSVQLEGVKSDVEVPGRFSYIDVGEKDKENPLPWDEIDAAPFTPWKSYYDYDETVKRSKQRMRKNEQLRLIAENAKWVKTKIDETVYSLNYDSYNAENKRNESEAESFNAISDYQTHLLFRSTSYEQSLFNKDTTDLREKRERWHEHLSQDVYVEEALNVLEDLKTTLPAKKVAATNRSSEKK